MSKHLRFDDEEYNASDSDEEYNEREKSLLNKVRTQKKQYSDSEEEVYGVNQSDSESNQSDIALSDVEGQENNDDLPDIRAWGKDKRKYYGADYVDPDFGGFDGQDAQAAEIEEEEARNLQSQLVQQLDDGDFSLDVIFKKSAEQKGKGEEEEIIKTDISELSSKQKLQLLQKESPEFFALVEDFEVKMNLAKDFLHPVLQKYRKGQVRTCEAMDFVEMHFQLILNYGSNIYMYLLLKSNKKLQNHPIIKRLFQYRQLLSQMQPIFDEIIKPQIEILQENIESTTETKKQKKTLKILSDLKTSVKNELKNKKANKSKKRSVTFAEENEDVSNKKQKIENNESSDSESEQEMPNNEEKIENNKDENEKRAITYQMAKNKGLTPHRKKEQRNPRVKNKLKYRKAVIRRKGAVREPRKELSRYSGEISGIKATVSKSIKIKT